MNKGRLVNGQSRKCNRMASVLEPRVASDVQRKDFLRNLRRTNTDSNEDNQHAQSAIIRLLRVSIFYYSSPTYSRPCFENQRPHTLLYMTEDVRRPGSGPESRSKSENHYRVDANESFYRSSYRVPGHRAPLAF